MKFLLFVITLSVSANGELSGKPPSFTLNAERSLDGSPSVTVVFSDGYQDTLILSKFYTNEEERLEEEEDTCAYVGHLANEPEACVAMTGCFGQEDVEFSIASSHAADSGTYSWNMDGTVHVIDNPLREDRPSAFLRAEGDKEDKEVIHGDEILLEDDHKVEVLFEAFCWNGWGWGCSSGGGSNNGGGSNSNCVQASHTLDYKLVYDDGLSRSLGGSVQSKLQQTMAHVQTKYCHHSLGTKIKLNSVGGYKHIQGQNWMNSNDQYGSFRSWSQGERGNADLLVMVGDWKGQSVDGWAGLAYVGVVCTGPQYAYSMNMWSQTPASTSWIIAHEMGHNLGMSHDFDEPNKSHGCDTTGWMSYDVKQQQWSTCSKNNFNAHFTKGKSQWCMPEAASVCGGSGTSGCQSGSTGSTGSSGGGNWWDSWWGRK